MIKITDNFQVNKPAPIDDRLGPFISTAVALSSIELDRRYIGLTVIVDTGSGATEYWFEDGIQNNNLVAKSTGGGGGFNCADLLTCTDFTDLQTDVSNLQTDILDLVPYTGATQDVDLDNFNLDAKGVKINGTAGSGHLGLKHQSANATAGGQETALFAGSDGELYYKNDGLSVAQIPSKSYVDTQLSNKVTANGAITGATKTKITYDSKGLVTAGADLTFADLPTTSPTGYTSPLASIVSGGVVTETQITTVTIPAGAFKSGDNILITLWGTRTTGGATGINSTISLRITNTAGPQMMTNQTGNRHQNFTITGKALSDTSIIWWPNSATTAANTTTVPSLLNNGFTISIGLIRTNTTDEFTLYNCIVRKYS